MEDCHEWVKKDGQVATVGITKKACGELGEIVYIELPKIGQKIKRGEEVVVLESTKAAIDSYAPIDGEVIAVNEDLRKNPKLLQEDPEHQWMYKLATI